MKRILFCLSLSFLTLFSTLSAHGTRDDQPNDRQRKQWFEEMRRYKADFIAKELNLTEEQKKRFIPIYEEMDARTTQLAEESRKMERDIIKKGDKVTDAEYEKTAEDLYEVKKKEGDLELEYFQVFKTILTKKQLFHLKGAERKFTRQLMDKHREGGRRH